MKWRDIVSSGQTYSMAHLHPFTTGVQVGSRQIDLHVTFGWHVFTDEKGNGMRMTRGPETRFFCPQRYVDSHQAPPFIQNQMAAGYVRPFIAKGSGQMFFVFDIANYAMFFTFQKPPGTTNELKCHLVSAYSVNQWGLSGLPTRAKLRKMGYVLDRRERGEVIPLT